MKSEGQKAKHPLINVKNANMSECYDNFAQEAAMTMEQRIESRKARSKGFFKKK